MNNKNTVTILMIATVIIAIIGGTFAYWNWQSSSAQRTNVTFTVASGFTCGADGGGDITSSDVTLAPAACTNPEYAIQRTVKVNTTQDAGKTISLDMWLKVNSIGTYLSQSENFKYALTTNSESCSTDVITTGTFNGTSNGSELPLLSGKEYEETTANDTYYLYIWLDAAETNLNTMNQAFNITVEGSCTDELSSSSCPSMPTVPLNNSVPNAPVLDDGLIPVTIANDGTVTAISSNNANWYNYSNKQWANAVLTTSTNRSTYQSIASGNTASTTIPTNEILAYFVWIPRYKYAIPEALTCGCIDNVNATDYPECYVNSELQEQTTINNPRTIDIVFETANTPKSNGTATGTSYYTHPAFTFGSEELPGFWVGKFETTGDATTPTILPNVNSQVWQNVSTQFATSLKFAGGTQSGSAVTFAGNNTYGVTSTADSHMMKNSEWGAVAYLSHSNYGINDEIRINNYWDDTNYVTLTGCGAGTINANESSTCDIAYGSASSYPQSTTGNVTGVFDMSGGTWEHVMGHWSDSLNEPTYERSGFSTLPVSKYIDIYSSDIFTENNYSGNNMNRPNISFCTLQICGGHALHETDGWYSDYSSFVLGDSPWFVRGGDIFGDVGAGALSFIADGGGTQNRMAFRSVLVAR